MSHLDADVIKIATTANEPHDNVRMLQLVRESKIPTVGICMGEIGIPSRLLAGKFGAPFTYSTFHHERTLAPGQLSFWQMKDIYHYDEINADTRVYGFIADPIGQSIVPIVHNAAFHALGINSVCVPFRVPREYLSSFLYDSRELDLDGLSVGVPHRDSLLQSLHKLDKAADGIGAVNTVAFHADRSTFGYNTDHRAAMAALVRASGVKSENPLDGKRALVLGAGSVAKAVVYGTATNECGGGHRVADARNARKLAEAADSRAVEWDSRYSVRIDILLNCTPVGMHPNVDETPFAPGQLRRTWLVFDAVYDPEQTLLVKDARLKGCRVVTGVEMFIRQVALQFKVFTNQEPPIEVMRLASRAGRRGGEVLTGGGTGRASAARGIGKITVNVLLNVPSEIRLAFVFFIGLLVGGQLNRGIYRLAWFSRDCGPWSPPPADAPPRSRWDHLPVIGWWGCGVRPPGTVGATGYAPCSSNSPPGLGSPCCTWVRSTSVGCVRPCPASLPSLAALYAQCFSHLVLVSLMIVATFIDFDEQTIPDDHRDRRGRRAVVGRCVTAGDSTHGLRIGPGTGQRAPACADFVHHGCELAKRAGRSVFLARRVGLSGRASRWACAVSGLGASRFCTRRGRCDAGL